MGPTDAELVDWFFANAQMKALVDAGLLLVSTEVGTKDGMPYVDPSKSKPGVRNIPKKPLTEEQRAAQRRMNQGMDPDSEPLPWWCDFSDPAVMAANIAATAVNVYWLMWVTITCHRDEFAGPTVQIAQEPGVRDFPTFGGGSSIVTLALALGGIPMITLDTPKQMIAARKAAHLNSNFKLLPPGSRLVLELLWRVLQDKDLNPIGFAEFEFVNNNGLVSPRAGLLSPAEALRLWLRRVGLALYAEVQLTGASADAKTGRIQSLTKLSSAEYFCLLAPVVMIRTDGQWQDPVPVHGLVDEDPQNLSEVLSGPLFNPTPPPGVDPADWPVVFGKVPRVNAQLLFSTMPLPGETPLIFPGGFWDVNPLSAQVAAVQALIQWKDSEDAAIAEAEGGQGDAIHAGAIRAVRAVKRWVADHCDSQEFCDVDFFEAMRGDTAMPNESWGKLNSLSKWWPGVPTVALVSPNRIWKAKKGLDPVMLLGEMLQAVEISLLRSCNCPVRLARLAPFALETLVASTTEVMTSYGNREFAPPVYFGAVTPWRWAEYGYVPQMVLPALGRVNLGPMTRHSPTGWLRDPLLLCVPVQNWWDMHPVRTLGDMGPVNLTFDNSPGQSAAGPIKGNIDGMLKVQAAQGIDWQEICGPIWNQVIDSFLQTGFSRFGGALVKKPLLPVPMLAELHDWGTQKLPAGWQPEPNQQARWRQSFFEFAQTNGVVPGDIVQAPGFPVIGSGGKLNKQFMADVPGTAMDTIAKSAFAPFIALEQVCIADKTTNLKLTNYAATKACRRFEVYPVDPAVWPGAIMRESTVAGIDAFAAQAADLAIKP